MIHDSPPCAATSNLRHLLHASTPLVLPDDRSAWIVNQLNRYSHTRQSLDGVAVPWSVEGVSGAIPTHEKLSPHRTTLCGTMFGHAVFRHRSIIFSDFAPHSLRCNHEGKVVGDKGLEPNPSTPGASSSKPGNMYAPYSWQSTSRGTLDELHHAMGFAPGSFTYRGLTQGLPSGYGQLIASQLTALYFRGITEYQSGHSTR